MIKSNNSIFRWVTFTVLALISIVIIQIVTIYTFGYLNEIRFFSLGTLIIILFIASFIHLVGFVISSWCLRKDYGLILIGLMFMISIFVTETFRPQPSSEIEFLIARLATAVIFMTGLLRKKID